MLFKIEGHDYITIAWALTKEIENRELQLKSVPIGPQLDPANQFAHMSVAECLIKTKQLRKRLYDQWSKEQGLD